MKIIRFGYYERINNMLWTVKLPALKIPNSYKTRYFRSTRINWELKIHIERQMNHNVNTLPIRLPIQKCPRIIIEFFTI